MIMILTNLINRQIIISTPGPKRCNNRDGTSHTVLPHKHKKYLLSVCCLPVVFLFGSNDLDLIVCPEFSRLMVPMANLDNFASFTTFANTLTYNLVRIIKKKLDVNYLRKLVQIRISIAKAAAADCDLDD